MILICEHCKKPIACSWHLDKQTQVWSSVPTCSYCKAIYRLDMFQLHSGEAEKKDKPEKFVTVNGKGVEDETSVTIGVTADNKFIKQ